MGYIPIKVILLLFSSLFVASIAEKTKIENGGAQGVCGEGPPHTG